MKKILVLISVLLFSFAIIGCESLGYVLSGMSDGMSAAGYGSSSSSSSYGNSSSSSSSYNSSSSSSSYSSSSSKSESGNVTVYYSVTVNVSYKYLNTDYDLVSGACSYTTEESATYPVQDIKNITSSELASCEKTAREHAKWKAGGKAREDAQRRGMLSGSSVREVSANVSSCSEIKRSTYSW